MAGNGREWTRDLFASVDSENEVPLHRPPKRNFDRVFLRGHSYLEPEPLRFDSRLDRVPDSVGYLDSAPDIGFRVVIELPR
jgi:hypothetical protein